MNEYSTTDIPHSRVHRIPSFDTTKARVWIKREDELGPVSMGVKLRKYHSLVPFIQSQGKEVALYGSASSNNILALTTVLKEKKVPLTLFLSGTHPSKVQGNFFFTCLCYPPEEIIWVEKGIDFESLAHYYEPLLGKKFLWVPMGASCKESLPGAITLGQDIIENEKKIGVSFSHIFIDSGTGFTASALLLYFGLLKKQCKIHITLTAGTAIYFLSSLEKHKEYFKQIYQIEPYVCDFEIITPHKAKSFGSISKEHIHFIKDFASQEGVFLDPAYNAKHFLAAKKAIEESPLTGEVLIIQSGGTLSLSGFSEHFN